ncbi:MAG: hypothetical protein IT261_05825 [Saprospiraceae bacterium]|nr:hypothetical protein [Saprospiraceae bacterium]
MKKPVKLQTIRRWKALLFSLLLLIGSSGFAPPSANEPLSCVIESVQCTANAQGSASYSWGAVSGATAYKVYYVRLSDGFTSPVSTVSGTSHTFTGLSSGAHRFYFAPVCGSGTLEYISDDIIVL